MLKGKLIALATATIIGTGVIAAVLNQDSVNKLQNEVDRTKNVIANYETAEQEMKGKYTSLKTQAESEIDKANEEVEKANKIIQEQGNKLAEILENSSPMTESELNEYTGKLDKVVEDQSESIIKNLNVSFAGACNVDFTLSKGVNIGLTKKGNVKIEFYGKEGELLKKKDKTWSGYLNDVNGNKYGQDILNPSKYGTELKAGEKYSTTLTGEEFSGKVTKVILTVTDGDGNKSVVEAIK